MRNSGNQIGATTTENSLKQNQDQHLFSMIVTSLLDKKTLLICVITLFTLSLCYFLRDSFVIIIVMILRGDDGFRNSRIVIVYTASPKKWRQRAKLKTNFIPPSG